MSPFMVGVLVFAAVVISGITIGRAGKAGMESGKRPPVNRIKDMSWHEVERLLDRVAKEPAPESVMGAMCYAAMAVPDVSEYVCPVCGEKTLYASDETFLVLREIPEARAQFALLQQVSELEMRLDETAFCSYCRSEGAAPRLVLEISYSDGPKVSSEITAQDLRYLVGLFGNGLTYSTWNDGLEPLKPHLERIMEILGFTHVRQ
ncbi:hypothetical protein GX411_00835 [Candidatus Fermentibacteria bacterium]|nr:hypothetical protein [Candidatus Fermentibacteria bacterium]